MRPRVAFAWLGFPTLLGGVVALAAPARAATPGFVEDFATGSAGFGSMGSVAHVSSGGVGGAGDGYLEIARALSGNLGAFSADVELVGDLPADGVTGFSFWLRDVGADDAHEIHVGVGPAFANFWLSVPGFVPPDDGWQEFSVDFDDESEWVRIQGSGSFQDALAASNRLLFRHDVAPLVFNPDPTLGDFGLDRIQVLPAPAAIPAVSAAGRVALVALLVALVARPLGGALRAR